MKTTLLITLLSFTLVGGIYAVDLSADLPQRTTTESLDAEVQSALNNTISTAQNNFDDIATRLQTIMNEYDRREGCHSQPGGGMFYDGTDCHIPQRVEQMYLSIACSRSNPACPAGYTATSGGAMVDYSYVLGDICGTYCRVRIGRSCIWYGGMGHRYSFCTRHTPGRTIAPPVSNPITLSCDNTSEIETMGDLLEACQADPTISPTCGDYDLTQDVEELRAQLTTEIGVCRDLYAKGDSQDDYCSCVQNEIAEIEDLILR